MRMITMIRIFVCVAFVWGVAFTAEARSLSQQIDQLFGDLGIQVQTPGHVAHFSSDSLSALGTLVRQLAPNAADFPATSTTPGFTYRYNPDLQVFERSTTSLGPVFVERPQTIGKGRFDVGASNLFIDFKKFDGMDLDSLSFRNLKHGDCCAPPLPSPGVPPFENDTAGIFFEEFTLRSNVLSFFATYGITDRWDVNILLPLVWTNMRIHARAVLDNQSGIHLFDKNDPGVSADGMTRQVSVDDDKFGVGDLLLRTKYRVYGHESGPNKFNFASGLTLRIPTGDADNFQGIGDTTLTPFFSGSFERGIFGFYANTGFEWDIPNSNRSRVRYGVSMTLQALEKLGLYASVIGSSNLGSPEVTVNVPEFAEFSPEPVGTRTVSTNTETDIVDLSVGLKANIVGSMVGYVGVIVPLNSDGLRANAIPAVGLEGSF